MHETHERGVLTLDPRSKIILLLLANIVAFSYKLWWIEYLTIALLALLQILMGCRKLAFKWLAVFSLLVLFQYYILPILPKILSVALVILTVYLRKIFPCFMVGGIIIKTTPVHTLIAALKKWNLSEKIIIPFAVTLRYFPAICEEHRHIRDAMKLKKIKGLAQKMEAHIVPLLISSLKTADELSAAAITRGIENPNKKTSIVELSFSLEDYIVIAIGILLCIIAIVYR